MKSREQIVLGFIELRAVVAIAIMPKRLRRCVADALAEETRRLNAGEDYLPPWAKPNGGKK
jgi:hypothetical protein